jgi:D-alanyl-D-alanine carboxypeptidase/D-alanyl-D-alanine-endopeptidase (penicillin-binding protein 4)
MGVFSRLRTLFPVAAAALALAAPAAGAATHADALRSTLGRSLAPAGSASGAYVLDANTGEQLFSSRSGTRRILASNAKIFTTTAALDRFGADGVLQTDVLSPVRPDENGVVAGDIYLRGSGDPTFGSKAFAQRNYGGGASVEKLAGKLRAAGIKKVQGRVIGDESRFDSKRGVPDSGFAISPYIGGPLSGLAFNRGLANTYGSAIQRNPPAFAALQLQNALKREGVSVSRSPIAGRTPKGARELAATASPPMSVLARLTNKHSDNFFAEMLVKNLAVHGNTPASTVAGARSAAKHARTFGASPHLVDGSGLSRPDQASPKSVVRLLNGMRDSQGFDAFYASLPIAGRDGTLGGRMGGGPAAGNCRAKTGTLSNVSALSGYCRDREGHTLVFSFLMNRVSVGGARAIQDRMAQTLAGYSG